MKPHLWISCVGILIFLTSCNSFVPSSQPTAVSDIPDVTETKTATSATPLEPEMPTPLPPTLSQTSVLPTMTSTPIPSYTPEEPTQIPTLTPTKKLVLKPTATQALLGAQIGSPVGIPNFAHPELGCQWLGLAGQVLAVDDLPVMDIVVEVGGTLDGSPVLGLAVTGESNLYGPGGYEIKLGDEPIASDGTIWAQVFDLDGNPISSPTYFPTYADCEKNLILLNFVQTRTLPSAWVFLPIIYNKSLNP